MITFLSTGFKTFHVWFIVLFILSFIAYVVEFFFEKTFRYLWNMNILESFVDLIERFRKRSPSIVFHCECYHWETRVRIVSYTDSQGHTQTRTETYQEKVVTHRESESFHYSRCEDVSGRLTSMIFEFNTVRVDFSKSWRCGNTETQNAYDRQRGNFISRNEHRDVHFDFWETDEIEGFTEHAMSVVDAKKMAPGINMGVYLFVGLVCYVGVFYRYWLDRVTVFARYHFTKEIYV
jgi:hypothetical protein